MRSIESEAPASSKVAKLVLMAIIAATITGLTGCGESTTTSTGGTGTAGLGAASGAQGQGATSSGTTQEGLTSSVNAGLQPNSGTTVPGSTTSGGTSSDSTTSGGTSSGSATVPSGSDQTQRDWCQKYLNRVNQHRTKIGVSAAKFDERLFQGCLQRVPDLANGMDGHAGYTGSDGGVECLAGTTDPVSTADLYYQQGPGEAHYEAMYGAGTSRIAGATGKRASVAHAR